MTGQEKSWLERRRENKTNGTVSGLSFPGIFEGNELTVDREEEEKADKEISIVRVTFCRSRREKKDRQRKEKAYLGYMLAGERWVTHSYRRRRALISDGKWPAHNFSLLSFTALLGR